MVTKIDNPADYMEVAEIFIEYPIKHCKVSPSLSLCLSMSLSLSVPLSLSLQLSSSYDMRSIWRLCSALCNVALACGRSRTARSVASLLFSCAANAQTSDVNKMLGDILKHVTGEEREYENLQPQVCGPRGRGGAGAVVARGERRRGKKWLFWVLEAE